MDNYVMPVFLQHGVPYTCRICGDNKNTVYNIFETAYDEYQPVAKIFEESMSIKISPDDGQSHTVCNECLEQAWHALAFKKTWQNSHSSLGKYFETLNEAGSKRGNQTEEIEDDYNGDAEAPTFPQHVSGLYECKLCKKPFFTFKNLQHHLVIHVHNTQCRICKLDCYDVSALKKHYAQHKKNKLTLCSWCGGVVVNGFHNADFNYNCPFCKFVYPCNLFLQNHIVQDHPDDELSLQDVTVTRNDRGDLFEDPDGLMLDVDSWRDTQMEDVGNIVDYKCSECDRIFDSMRRLEKHVTQLRCMYVCDICGCKYKLKMQLKIHMMDKHLGIRPFLCCVCGKSFVRRGMLQSHQQVHIQEKRFQCHECGRKFVSSATLQYHSRLHTGEKPYVCTLCGEAFVKCSRLREHQQKWHIGKLQCPVCMTTFAQRCSLKTHMDRFHPNTYDRKCSYLMNQSQQETLGQQSIVSTIQQ